MKPWGTPLLQVVSGSRATGTHTEESDTDLLGVFAFPTNDVLSFPLRGHSESFHGKLGEEEYDVTWWEAGHAFSIILRGNFNALPLLFSPEVLFSGTYGDVIRDGKEYFLSQKIVESILGYATKELRRYEEGKKIKNPNPHKALVCVYRELVLAERLLASYSLKEFNIQLLSSEVILFQRIKNKELSDEILLALLNNLLTAIREKFDNYDGWLPEKPDYEAARQVLIGIRRSVVHDGTSPVWLELKLGIS